MNQYRLLLRNMIDKKQAVYFENAETADARPKECKVIATRTGISTFMRCVARTTSARRVACW
jgi:hypothetical protein